MMCRIKHHEVIDNQQGTKATSKQVRHVNRMYENSSMYGNIMVLSHIYHVCTIYQYRDSSPYHQVISHSILRSYCILITSKHTVTGLVPWEQSDHLVWAPP